MAEDLSVASKYQSTIRDEQKESTRRRILEALVRVIARGPASVTIPAVADEAGVSVPTVYRHFGDKEGLLVALAPMIGEMLEIDLTAAITDMDDVAEFVRDLFRRLDQADPVVRAALASGAAPEARKSSAEMRVDAVGEVFSRLAPRFSPSDLERLSMVLVIMTCSDALRLWQDRFDIDADEAAENVIWAIRRMVESGQEPTP